MAKQVDPGQMESGTVLGTPEPGPEEPGMMGTVSGTRGSDAALSVDAPGTPGNYEPFHGRPVSWVAVSIIVIGFLAGGLALVFGPTWWLFWTGAAVTAIGGLLATSTNIFEDWY